MTSLRDVRSCISGLLDTVRRFCSTPRPRRVSDFHQFKVVKFIKLALVMVKYCVVGRCNNSSTSFSMHKWPKHGGSGLKQKWNSFVKTTRQWKSHTETSAICGQHFDSSCFRNFNQVRSGFAKRLCLREDAVPSIRYPAKTPPTGCAAAPTWGANVSSPNDVAVGPTSLPMKSE